MGEVIAAIGGEEVSFGIVYAAKGDGMLGFEGIEDAVGVFGIFEGKRDLDIGGDEFGLGGGEAIKRSFGAAPLPGSEGGAGEEQADEHS